MPSWLRVRGEFRERFEGFENSNFIEGRDDAYALSRFRFNVAVTATKHLAFQANLQDARVAGKEVGPTTAPFRGPFDLRTAFADVGDAKAAIALRLGRQELVFGESAPARLAALGEYRAELGCGAGHPALADVPGRSSSARRSCAACPTSSTRAATAIGWQAPTRRRPSCCRGRPSSRTCSGAATSISAVSSVRSARSRRRRSEHASPASCPHGSTTASRWPCSEEASTRTRISAWAGHWQLRSSLPGWAVAEAHLRIQLRDRRRESRPTASRQTFDQLYPTGHDKLGLVRPDRLAQHSSPSRGHRDHADQGDAHLAQLSLVVAGEPAPTASIRRAAPSRPASRRRRGEHPRRPGDRRSCVSRAITPAAPTGWRLRPHHQRRVPARSDARRVIQLSVRDGHVRLPGGEDKMNTRRAFT